MKYPLIKLHAPDPPAQIPPVKNVTSPLQVCALSPSGVHLQITSINSAPKFFLALGVHPLHPPGYAYDGCFVL